MFENNPFVQVLKTLWKHCWTLSWQESRGVLPISGFDKSNYKTKSLRENWGECQTYFQAKGQFTINKFSEKSKPRAAVHQPKPGRGPFGSPTQGKWKCLGWMWKKRIINQTFTLTTNVMAQLYQTWNATHLGWPASRRQGLFLLKSTNTNGDRNTFWQGEVNCSILPSGMGGNACLLISANTKKN